MQDTKSELERLLRDGNNHAFAVRHITEGGFDVLVNRSKAQLLRSAPTPTVTQVVVMHLAGCVCKPMPRWRRKK